MSHTLFIRNMVCNRCIMAVEQVLDQQGLKAKSVSLGEVVLEDEVDAGKLAGLDLALEKLGFERIDDRKARLIEAIKAKVIEYIYQQKDAQKISSWSSHLAEDLHYDYNYLSNLFSSVEGMTLEQYVIRQKIERVKELLFYDEFTLSQIAYQLGYSSVAHLSAQFKKVTGFTPSEMKKNIDPSQIRKSIDQI